MSGNLQHGSGGGGGGPVDSGSGFDSGEFVEDVSENALGVHLPGGQAIGGRFGGGALQIGWQNIDSVSQMLGGPDLPSSGDNPESQDAFERVLGGGTTAENDLNVPGTDQNVDLPSTNQFQRIVTAVVVVVVLGGALYLLNPILSIIAGVVGG